MKHYQTMLGKPDRSRSEQTCHSQGKAAGLEAMRSAAAEEKEAAVRRSAKAELDLQELQERIASVGSVQVRIISTDISAPSSPKVLSGQLESPQAAPRRSWTGGAAAYRTRWQRPGIFTKPMCILHLIYGWSKAELELEGLHSACRCLAHCGRPATA